MMLRSVAGAVTGGGDGDKGAGGPAHKLRANASLRQPPSDARQTPVRRPSDARQTPVRRLFLTVKTTNRPLQNN